jgi:hypothetical protein
MWLLNGRGAAAARRASSSRAVERALPLPLSAQYDVASDAVVVAAATSTSTSTTAGGGVVATNGDSVVSSDSFATSEEEQEDVIEPVDCCVCRIFKNVSKS